MEMDYILKCVPEVVEYLRGMSPVWRDLQTSREPIFCNLEETKNGTLQ